MFFSKCVHQGRHAERKAVIGRDHKFVLTQPAKIPPISLAASTTSLDRYQSRTCGRGTRSTSSIWNALCGATNVAPSHIKLDGEKVGRKHVSARMKKYGTSTAFSPKLKDGNIRLSVDSKGSWRDNVFVECLWLSIKLRRSISRLTVQ